MSEEKEQAPRKGEEFSVNSSGELPINEIAPYWLAALIDSADDAIISKTLDGIITSWNKGAERIFGYTAAEAIGKPVLMLIPPDLQNEEPAILERIGRGERVEHYETVRVRKDGRPLDISLTISPIKTPDGKIIGASKIARDISDLKQAENALRESEHQLRQITDAIPVLISYVDKEHRYRFVNRKYTEWFGYSSEQLLGKHIRDVVGEAGYKLVLPRIERVMSGEQFEFKQLMPYPGDKKIYIHVNYIPNFDSATGEVKGFYALVQDITESKKAETRLLESEARFSKAFSSSPLVLTISSLKTGKLLEVNETFVRTTGFSREEALGRTTIELGLWAKPQEREQELETVRREGKIRNAEYVFRVKDEKEIIGLLSAEQIEIGGESFALTVIQDITERKLAEDALRKSQEHLQLAMEASKVFSWELNLITNKIIFSNNVEEVIGFNLPPQYEGALADFIHPEDREPVQQAYGAWARGERHSGIELRLIVPDTGEIIWLYAQGVLVNDATDNQPRMVGITQNIDRRKKAEEEREEILRREQAARREAEEASRLKDEFLATVSHELRTPLNAILGWSQMLKSNNLSENDSSRALETIYRNAKSQAQLIEDILDVSRIITGKLRLDPKPVLLAPVIHSAVETLRPSIEAKNIRLQMHLQFEPRTINGDPDRLQQVVWNLLSNAIKFTQDGGEVKIELAGDETETKIVVSDTGKGISPEFLPFVFERFRQADGSSTRKHGGLGLGLAIVRHIVELHGGGIEVKSGGENNGTTFTVHLPLMNPRTKTRNDLDEEIYVKQNFSPAVATAQSIADNHKIEGLRILLVDDEIDTLEMLSIALQRVGAQVKAETSPRAALEIIEEWLPDVVVSDIAMPEEDGYTFIKKLRALPVERGGTIPAIALTAYVGIRERTQVLSNGFQMYVPKPVEPSELIAALANFVEREN